MRLSEAFKKKNPNHPHVKHPRRPGPRRPRKLSTSQAAIRRFEALKRQRAGKQGTGRGESRPLPGRGPSGGTGRSGGRKPIGRAVGRTGSVNTGSKGRPVGKGRRPRTTSEVAIARYKGRIARGRGRVAGRPVRGPRRR